MNSSEKILYAIDYHGVDVETKVCEWLNAYSASVDEDGDVWIEKAGGDRWLTEEEKEEFIYWLDHVSSTLK